MTVCAHLPSPATQWTAMQQPGSSLNFSFSRFSQSSTIWLEGGAPSSKGQSCRRRGRKREITSPALKQQQRAELAAGKEKCYCRGRDGWRVFFLLHQCFPLTFESHGLFHFYTLYKVNLVYVKYLKETQDHSVFVLYQQMNLNIKCCSAADSLPR